ncbi:MAG: 16S rRNA (cytosine(1402)-N(4))-methyltransferase RsmH [Magnetococcales bacterium]|nr:16S rRNA (cytosine(1402)-N(4))-methyltransferase RsmH [Magnetococcales bacterium]
MEGCPAQALSGESGGYHTPVMTSEVLEALAPQSGSILVDATYGGGGHSHGLLVASAPHGRVIALDRDPEAIAHGAGAVQSWQGRLTLLHGTFGRLADSLRQLGIERVDGVLFDLGVSSRQLDVPERGFSFQADGPLDMRMNPVGGPTAADLVNRLGQEELADLVFHHGDERHARRVARAIVAARLQAPLTTTRQLAKLLERVVPGKRGGIHPATRTFQALRIAVNDELGELRSGLAAGVTCLKPGGRLVAISFHSLEDRLVKEAFRQGVRPPVAGDPRLPPPVASVVPVPTLRLIARKPWTASPAEVQRNPRARSARMRVAERLPGRMDGA